MSFRLNHILREEDKVYLKDTPTHLVDYANDRHLVDAFKTHGIVSKAYLMRKYQITWKEAYGLSLQLLELFKGNMEVCEIVDLCEEEKSKRKRFY